jgi:hypothetical protein
MPLVFSEVGSEQVNGLWPHISQGADETYRRWQDKVEWVPNDLFDTIRKDKAKVSFIYDDNKRIGFLVYRIFCEEFTMRKYLHIWLAYLYPEFRFKLSQYLPQGLNYLQKIAKYYDCTFIEMDSLRSGWERLLKEFGLKPRRIVYRKEI